VRWPQVETCEVGVSALWAVLAAGGGVFYTDTGRVYESVGASSKG